jgi:hypothetical protein
MTSEDQRRAFAEWYVATLGRTVEAIAAGGDGGSVIRQALDELTDVQARNFLQMKLADDAVRAHEQMTGRSAPGMN